MSMRKLFVCCALFISACISGHSQTAVRVNIPFNFTVDNKPFPAGEYDMTHAFRANDTTWLITNHRGSTSFILTQGIQSPIVNHTYSLIFHRYDGQYSLVEFWPQTGEGRALIKAKRSPNMIAQSELVQIAAER